MMNSRNGCLFTASQWQELEQQALVYKYMASGIPIPTDLLFNIRRSYLDSPMSARLISHPSQHVGWNYLQMTLGRKIDPEPGRCRRTDGKKWRCSKEAYPESKYCERHMHRGKNRSRKPVEVLKTTPSNTNSFIPHNPSATFTPNRHFVSAFSSSSLSAETHHHPQCHPCYTSNSPRFHLPFLHHNNSNANANGFSFEDSNTTPWFLDTVAAYPDSSITEYRYVYGLKQEVDEHEPSGTVRTLSASSDDDSLQFTPLTTSSCSSKQRNCSGVQEYSYLELQSLRDSTKQDQTPRSCYGLSDDEIKYAIPMRLRNDEAKTMHRFFDELPHKGRGSWLDLDDKISKSSLVSTTQLSISVPASHDFPSV